MAPHQEMIPSEVSGSVLAQLTESIDGLRSFIFIIKYALILEINIKNFTKRFGK